MASRSLPPRMARLRNVACAIGLDFSPEGRARLESVLEQSLSYAEAIGARLLNLYCGPGPDGEGASSRTA